jgi:outer membrane receptor protein involved in Fe transport
MSLHKYIVGLVAGTAICSAHSAFSQDVHPQDTHSQDTHSQDAPSGEVVVTAQRRAERIRDVPISVTSSSGEALRAAGVVNIMQLAQITPGVTMRNFGGLIAPVVRGIASSGGQPGEAANVATYVDGVYQVSQRTSDLDFFDVDRREHYSAPTPPGAPSAYSRRGRLSAHRPPRKYRTETTMTPRSGVLRPFR